MVGGKSFSERALVAYFILLKNKYPRATIVTGSAAGAERSIRELATHYGFEVEVPEVWHILGKEAAICQVNNIVLGADVIVCVGSPTSGRTKRAVEVWHRLNMHKKTPQNGILKVNGKPVSMREPWNQIGLHFIAAPVVAEEQQAA